jgi:hypothetical protein
MRIMTYPTMGDGIPSDYSQNSTGPSAIFANINVPQSAMHPQGGATGPNTVVAGTHGATVQQIVKTGIEVKKAQNAAPGTITYVYNPVTNKNIPVVSKGTNSGVVPPHLSEVPGPTVVQRLPIKPIPAPKPTTPVVTKPTPTVVPKPTVTVTPVVPKPSTTVVPPVTLPKEQTVNITTPSSVSTQYLPSQPATVEATSFWDSIPTWVYPMAAAAGLALLIFREKK